MATSKIKEERIIFGDNMKNQLTVYSDKIASGWLFDVRGTDKYGKTIRIGFDANTGIYAYYDDSLLWNIRP